MKLAVVGERLLFRKALCTLLDGAGIFASILEFHNVQDVINRIEKHESLVLIIHTTEAGGGVEWVQQLRDLIPEARALLLADDRDEAFSVRALEAGAWGCLSTTETPQVLIKAISKVIEGDRWFAHRVTNTVLDRLMAGRRQNIKFAEHLTPREWEVLSLIAQGHSDKEVASSLFISRETARSHVKSIYKKLQVSTRRAAAVCYFKRVRGESGRSNTESEAIAPSHAA